MSVDNFMNADQLVAKQPETAPTKSNIITPYELFKTALDTRNLEINLFWQRCNYFLVLNSALAYGVISVKSNDFLLPMAILGTLVCWLWYRVALGSKYWQERWEFCLKQLEDQLKGQKYFSEDVNLFSGDWRVIKNEVRDSLSSSQHSLFEKFIDQQILTKPSVTQSMIYLVIIFFFGWLILLLTQIHVFLRF